MTRFVSDALLLVFAFDSRDSHIFLTTNYFVDAHDCEGLSVNSEIQAAVC